MNTLSILLGFLQLSSDVMWKEEGHTYAVSRSKMHDPVSDSELTEFANSLEIRSAVMRLRAFSLEQYFTGRGAACSLDGRGFDIGFSLWRLMHQSCSEAKFQLIERLVWRGSSVVRLRNSDGSVSLKNSIAGDPRIFSLAGRSLAVTHFAFPRGGDSWSRAGVVVYVKADRPVRVEDLGAWATPLKQIRKALPFQSVSIILSATTHFPHEDYFPVLAPFVSVRQRNRPDDRPGPSIICPAAAEFTCRIEE